MTTKKKVVKKGNGVAAWEIGGAITAATLAAAAGVYLLSDKKTKAKAKKWAVEARKEIVKNVKTAKKLGEKEYSRMVDEVMKHRGRLEKLSTADIIKEAKELKSQWNKIQTEAKKMASKKSVRKAKTSKKKRA